MEFNADTFESGDYFAGPPGSYHINLPNKAKMSVVVLGVALIAKRRGSASVKLKLVRPLNEESGFAPITKMDEQDYGHVQVGLESYFKPKGLIVTGLELKHLKQIRRSEMADPYDLVEATFVVKRA